MYNNNYINNIQLTDLINIVLKVYNFILIN